MSGCDTLGRCQPSRIQEDVVSNWEPVHISVEDAGLCDRDCSSPLPSGSGCHVPASLPPARGRGLYAAKLALLSYLLSHLLCEQASLHVRVFGGKVLSLSFFSSGNPTV